MGVRDEIKRIALANIAHGGSEAFIAEGIAQGVLTTLRERAGDAFILDKVADELWATMKCVERKNGANWDNPHEATSAAILAFLEDAS
ncbi:MAG: hypothetical protein AAF583_01450 [Pseudomonadota bacterium]